MHRFLTVLMALVFVLSPVFAEEENRDRDILMSLQKSIIEHIGRNEWEQAEKACKQGIEKAQKTGNPAIAGAIYGLMGGAYRAQKRYEDAAHAWWKAIAIEQKQPRPDTFLLGTHYNNIGEAYRAAGENEKSLAALLEGRKVLGDQSGAEFLLQNLGMTYVRMNRDADAEEAFMKSIKVGVKGPQPSRENTIESMYSLALLFARKQRYDECLILLKTAVPAAEKVLPAGDSRIRVLRQMRMEIAAARLQKTPWKESMTAGDEAMKEKMFPEAISSFERALKIAQEVAPGTVGEGNSLMKLGTTQVMSGDASAGVETLSKAVPIYEENFGADHEESVTVRKMLELSKGVVERSRGGVSAGSASGVQGMGSAGVSGGAAVGVPGGVALGIPEMGVGAVPLIRLQPPGGGGPPTTPKELYSMGSLQSSVWMSSAAAGKAAVDKGDYAGAAKHYAKALQQAELFGAQDPRLVGTLTSLGSVYLKLGQFGKAVPLFERSLPLTEKAHGKNSNEVVGILEALAVCRVQQHEFAQALPLVRRVVQIQEPALGANHKNVIAARKLYGKLAALTGAPPLPASRVSGAKGTGGVIAGKVAGKAVGGRK